MQDLRYLRLLDHVLLTCICVDEALQALHCKPGKGVRGSSQVAIDKAIIVASSYVDVNGVRVKVCFYLIRWS